MIDVQPWMEQAVAVLRQTFRQRILFIGLQGSYRRGEAREDSDIDILSILDMMDVADLALYRRGLRTLPEGEKACGFSCGREELAVWPAFELFQFAQDTDAYYGELGALLPPFTREDTVTGARIAVSGLHHSVAWMYVSGDTGTRAEVLKGAYKGFFFAMQVIEYLRSGVYAQAKRELLSRLSGVEAELLRLSMDPDAYRERQERDPDGLFQGVLTWTGRMMRELVRY